MPTTGGPTNLPLYESFYFKKVIFYPDNLVYNKELSEILVSFDINKPDEFYKKIINLQDNEKNIITKKAFEFYKKKCSVKNFTSTYLSIFENFLDDEKKWKN